jgi:glycosyltransferase involved in cell wall biosynthesis
MNDFLLGKSLNRFGEIAGRESEIFDTAFCVDATGLYAFKKSGIRAGKLVNLSFEILEINSDNCGESLKKIKYVETRMLQNEVKHVIIQDKYRKQFLERTIGKELHCLYLPNSIRKDGQILAKGKYFHELFGLDDNVRIILSAGMIGESVSSLDIAKAIGEWETSLPVKVVFHERLPIDKTSTYLDKILSEGKGRVLLSLNPLSFDHLYKIFSSVDLGLAIYNKELGDNFGIIGSASGKLFQYIKHGLPVIASDLPGLNSLIKDHDMGVVVESPNDIPLAIEKVMADYPYYSANARKAFVEELNMDLFLEGVYKEIYN